MFLDEILLLNCTDVNQYMHYYWDVPRGFGIDSFRYHASAKLSWGAAGHLSAKNQLKTDAAIGVATCTAPVATIGGMGGKDKQSTGTCRLCLVEGKMSFEHVPPQSAGNNRKIVLSPFEEWFSPDKWSGRGPQNQRGAGGHTLEQAWVWH